LSLLYVVFEGDFVADTALQKRMQRIGEIVEQLETSADPNTRAIARELLESLMALHGAGIERILEIAANSGEAGESVIRKCGRDELVSSLLLLYGLHPENLNARVTRALEKLRNSLEQHAAKAELLSITHDGVVRVRLDLKPNGGCGSTAATLKSTVESALQDAAPDATSIIVEETGALLSGSGFVSIAQLANGQSMAALVARSERSGD
jgi:Fe-S cluster biogenesis protein NfuA